MSVWRRRFIECWCLWQTGKERRSNWHFQQMSFCWKLGAPHYASPIHNDHTEPHFQSLSSAFTTWSFVSSFCNFGFFSSKIVRKLRLNIRERNISYSFNSFHSVIIDIPHTPLSISTWMQISPLRKQTGFLDESMNGVMALIKASRSNVLLLRRLMSQNH